MSLAYRVYLGPYIEAKVFEKEVTQTRVSCPNEKCESHGRWMGSNQFCPKCGSAIGEVPFTEIKYRAQNSHLRENLSDEELDHFYETLGTTAGMSGMKYSEYPFDNYVLNRKLDEVENRQFKKLEFDPLDCETVIQPVEQELMIREINAFKAQYAAEIELVTQWHGAENVNIKWGLLSWVT